jgi:acyl carrier protein
MGGRPGDAMPVSRDTLRTFLATDLGVDVSKVEDDTLLFSSGTIDSFSLVTLISFLEEQGEFQVDATDVNLDNLDSIERILAYVEQAKG